MTRQEQLFSEQEYLQSAIVKAGSLPHSEVSGLGILTIRREPLREDFKNVLADLFR